VDVLRGLVAAAVLAGQSHRVAAGGQRLLTVAEVGWAHGVGVVCLVGFVVVGCAAVGAAELSASDRR
jgi:hypothetical protein